MRDYRHNWIVLVAALALIGCGEDGTGTGGAGGTAGTGGTAGAGGSAGMGGTGGAGGTANTAPEATIIDPASDSGTSNNDYVYDGFDDPSGLWYKDLTVEGLGEDAEDGTLSGGSLQWKTDQTSIQAEVLGIGTNPTFRLYSDDCFGTTHVITLEVTDSDGATTISEPRTIFIWTLC